MESNIAFKKSEMTSPQLPINQTQKSSLSNSRLRWIFLGALGVAAAFVVKNQSARSSKSESAKPTRSHKEDF